MYVRIDGIKLVKSMQYVSFSKQLIKTAIVSNGVCITIMSQNILTPNLQSGVKGSQDLWKDKHGQLWVKPPCCSFWMQ